MGHTSFCGDGAVRHGQLELWGGRVIETVKNFHTRERSEAAGRCCSTFDVVCGEHWCLP